jgi:phosphoribosylglycinamide formyltransferase-1
MNPAALEPRRPDRLALLLSGRGSNLQAIARAVQSGELAACIVAVGSDQAEAAGVQWARAQGLSVHVHPRADYPDREAFEAALFADLAAARPDWIVLAGFMRVLSAATVQRWRGRMINLHPSLLPRHPGLATHRRALEAGDAEHGASVHFVTEVLDGGPVIAQVAMVLDPALDPDQVGAQLQPLEHRLLLEVVRWLVSGRLRLRDDRVELDGRLLERPLRLGS